MGLGNPSSAIEADHAHMSFQDDKNSCAPLELYSLHRRAEGLALAMKAKKAPTPSFLRQKCASQFFEKGAVICESFTRNPRRSELFLYFRERHGKTCDGLLSSARLHRSGRPPHRGWCGTMVRACSKTRQPVRRPNLRCALLRPISQPGPRAGTRHPIFAQCALALPIFSAVPSSVMPSRAGVSIERIRREPLRLTSRQTAPR